MSIKAQNWVWEHSPYKGTQLLIHIIIADRTNEDHENLFYLSNGNLAKLARCSRQYANSTLTEMVKDGFLKYIGKHSDQKYKGVIEYQFLTPITTNPQVVVDLSTQATPTPLPVNSDDTHLSTELTPPPSTCQQSLHNTRLNNNIYNLIEDKYNNNIYTLQESKNSKLTDINKKPSPSVMDWDDSNETRKSLAGRLSKDFYAACTAANVKRPAVKHKAFIALIDDLLERGYSEDDIGVIFSEHYNKGGPWTLNGISVTESKLKNKEELEFHPENHFTTEEEMQEYRDVMEADSFIGQMIEKGFIEYGNKNRTEMSWQQNQK